MDRLPKVTKEDIYKHFGIQFPAAGEVVKKTVIVPPKKKKKRSKKQLPPRINIDLSKIIFKYHALERFVERMFKLDSKFQTQLTPEELARKILAGSTEEDAIEPHIKVKRCITHKFIEARYFMNQGWRFVVVEKGDQFVVVTIERMQGHDAKPNKIRTLADVMPEEE